MRPCHLWSRYVSRTVLVCVKTTTVAGTDAPLASRAFPTILDEITCAARAAGRRIEHNANRNRIILCPFVFAERIILEAKA